MEKIQAKKMIMHAFKDFAIELFNHPMDQYVQLEDVADQIKELHKILGQNLDPNKESQKVYYDKILQDARNTLKIYVYTQQISHLKVLQRTTPDGAYL